MTEGEFSKLSNEPLYNMCCSDPNMLNLGVTEFETNVVPFSAVTSCLVAAPRSSQRRRPITTSRGKGPRWRCARRRSAILATEKHGRCFMHQGGMVRKGFNVKTRRAIHVANMSTTGFERGFNQLHRGDRKRSRKVKRAECIIRTTAHAEVDLRINCKLVVDLQRGHLHGRLFGRCGIASNGVEVQLGGEPFFCAAARPRLATSLQAAHPHDKRACHPGP